MRKLAVIRSDETKKCPFGLPITFGCKNAGTLVKRMAPVEFMQLDSEEKNLVGAANKRLLNWNMQDEKCIYADQFAPNKNVVNCMYGENVTESHTGPNLLGSPFYSHHFSSNGIEGLSSLPFSQYADYDTAKNMFYGIYSLNNEENKQLIKQASELIQLIFSNYTTKE